MITQLNLEELIQLTHDIIDNQELQFEEEYEFDDDTESMVLWANEDLIDD